MDLNNKYFFLNRECFYENGMNKGVIYNLYTEDLFVIEEPYASIIYLCERERFSLEKIIKIVNIENKINDKEISDFFKELLKLDLGQLYNEKIYIEKVKPISTKEEKLIQDEPPIIELLWLKITNSCNLKCNFCKATSKDSIGKCGCNISNNHSNEKLNITDWKEVIKDASLFNCQEVQFVGGEPLLKKENLFELIEYAKSMHIQLITLVTNGILLTSEVIDKLIINKVHFMIPFYSFQASVHDHITGIEGSHERVLNVIKEIHKKDGFITIEIIITKQNQNDFSRTIKYLKEMTIKNISSQILKTSDEIYFADKFYKKIYRTKEKFGKISKNQFFKSREGNPCWDGKLAVISNGNVLPCIMANNHCIGNIKNISIRQIIRSQELIGKYWNLSKDGIDVCQDCEFRYACSDCRVIESIDGTLTGKNKFCTYNPSTGIWGAIDNNQMNNLSK